MRYLYFVFSALFLVAVSCLAPTQSQPQIEEAVATPTPKPTAIVVKEPEPEASPTPSETACEIENSRLKEEIDSYRLKEISNYCECDSEYYD